DNNWGISVSAEESRAMNAYEYAAGFPGMERREVDGSDFQASYQVMQEVIEDVRKNRRPYLVRATVPLLGHHTSGVRKEFYRTEEDLQKHGERDPLPKLRKVLLTLGESEESLRALQNQAEEEVAEAFQQ